MGQAKLRGTREQRIAQAIERKKQEDERRHEQYRRHEAERRARLLALPPEARKVVLLGGGPSRLRLAAMLGLAGPLLIVDRDKSGS